MYNNQGCSGQKHPTRLALDSNTLRAISPQFKNISRLKE